MAHFPMICENGFYKFFPSFVGEVKLWETKNGTKLFKMRDFWTFESLANFPNYSFMGQFVFGIIPALVNYAGSPEEALFQRLYPCTDIPTLRKSRI